MHETQAAVADAEAGGAGGIGGLAAEIKRIAAQLNAATHRLLTCIRRFDEQRGWARQGALSCAQWLSWQVRLTPGSARARLRVAHALGELPQTDEAFARGEVSYSQVRAITRVATPASEGELLRLAGSSTAAQLERLCRKLRQVRDRQAAAEAVAEDLRFVRHHQTPSGMVRIVAELRPEEAAVVLKAIDAARHASGADPVSAELRRRESDAPPAPLTPAAGSRVSAAAALSDGAHSVWPADLADRSPAGDGSAEPRRRESGASPALLAPTDTGATAAAARGGAAHSVWSANIADSSPAEDGSAEPPHRGNGSPPASRTLADGSRPAIAKAPRLAAHSIWPADLADGLPADDGSAEPQRRESGFPPAILDSANDSRPAAAKAPRLAAHSVWPADLADRSPADDGSAEPRRRESGPAPATLAPANDSRASAVAARGGAAHSVWPTGLGDPTFPADGSAEPPTRPEAPSQRARSRADGLVAMAESFLAHGAPAKRVAARYEVSVHVDAAVLADASAEGLCELEDGTPLAAETARRLACDAPIMRVIEGPDGSVLDVGRRTRSIPSGLQRALRARDGGCRFPGCTNRLFVDGHHIEHWARGGETKLHNLVQLCRRHHVLVHEGGFHLERVNGELLFRDPNGRPLHAAPAPQPLGDTPSELLALLHAVDLDDLVAAGEPRWEGDAMDYDLCVELLESCD